MSTDIFKQVKFLARPIPSLASEERSNQPEASLDFIIDASDVSAQSARMSHKLQTMVTIVWKYGHELERDDNYGITGYMRPTCETFRSYFHKDDNEEIERGVNTPPCKECDKYHIDFLRTLMDRKDGILPDLKYFSYVHRELLFHNDDKIPYLEYRCPMLGYTELVFPVLVDGIFLGVVFVGQILRQSDNYAQEIFEDFITKQVSLYDPEFHKSDSSKSQNTLNRFFKKQEISLRQEYLKKLRELEVNGCSNSHYDLSNALITRHHSLLSDDNYKKLVDNAKDMVTDWNRSLKGIMIEKRRDLISSIFQSALDEAEIKCRELEVKEPTIKMSFQYAEILKEMLEMLRREIDNFGISNVRIFGFYRNPLSYSKKMEIVLSTNKDEMLNTAKRTESKFSFDYEEAIKANPKIKPDHPWIPKCSIYMEDYESVNIYNNIFSFISSKEKNETIMNNTHLAILYQKWMVLIEAEDINNRKDVYALVLKEFSFLMLTFLSRYELRLSKYVSGKYYLTLRMYRHECEHIARAIKSRVDSDFSEHFDNLSDVKKLWEKNSINLLSKLRSFIAKARSDNLLSARDDIVENVRLITHMADTVALLTERITLGNLDRHEKCSKFDIRNHILLKWQKALMNNLDQREYHKKIHIFNPVNISSEVHHRLRLIDLVVFNLIDNALKYSHWGTNIYITLGGGSEWESSVVPITIENYGYDIESDPKAYELFYRGSETDEDNPINKAFPDGRTHMDGDGLGLFIAKSISDMLELGVSYKSEHVSNYNVGLISSYLSRGKDIFLKDELETEKLRILPNMKKICNNEAYHPVSTAAEILGGVSQDELELVIKRPTYHITFQFQIQKRSTVT